jgi:hypothetical protein
MANDIEQYQARQGGVTLHTWIAGQGGKMANFSRTGVPGTQGPSWFRNVLRQKQLADLAVFPSCPSCVYDCNVSDNVPSSAWCSVLECPMARGRGPTLRAPARACENAADL